ncbi:MAG: leucine-rich repeat domain-containing protein, partial [Bacilli bacterium]|nr:leucine-rich repeat domain-containing protein [Bacilli bacterium]
YAVSGVNPTATEIIVPSTYKEAAVSKIMAGAFTNGSLITSLTIPDSVLAMEPGCLSGLSILEDLSLPFVGINRDAIGYDATLGTLFGVDAFPGTMAITHYFPSIVRKSYVAPSSLRKLTITDGPVLKAGSLSGLSMLTEVVVSDSITTIEAGTFAVTLSLKSMTLPFIGVTLDSTGTEGVLGAIFGRSSYGIVATYYLQGSYYYYLPNGLESLKITGGTFINDYSLMNLRNLREISLPSTIMTIGGHAFYNDISLTNIILPSQITRIGDLAFSYQASILPTLNPALNAIVLSSSLKEIGLHPFGYASENAKLVIYSSTPSTNINGIWDDLDAEYEMIFDVESSGEFEGLDYVTDKYNGTTILGPHFGNQDTIIVIPQYIDPDDSTSVVRIIASGAFAHDPLLEELWIEDNVYNIRSNAVAGENLTVYLEHPYIPEWWTTANWNPTGVQVVLDVTMP